MRKAWLLLVLAPSALFYACGGGDDSDGGSDAQNDSTSDVSAKLDTGITKDAVVDAGPLIACRKPVDCVGGDPNLPHPPAEAGVVCCGTLDLAGVPPNCDFISFTSKCQSPASCPSNIQIDCTTSIVRGCAFTQECTEVGYGLCCSVAAFGDASVCMSQQIATAVGAKCQP